MADCGSAANSKERVFGDFFHDLENAADRLSVVGRYAGAFPQWAADFHEEAALEEVLVSSQPLPSSGEMELPDFRLIREIARGGMGIVYEAEQLSLKRRVAVKVRRGRLAPSAHDRFQIEQEVLAQLHQTHIVPIHTAGQAGPWQYFAMAYIEGAALHRVVRATRNSTSRFGPKTPTLAGLAGEVLSGSREGDPGSVGVPHPGIGLKSTADDLRIDAAHRGACDASASSPTGGKPTLTLSHDYFRSVASVIADAAEALQHAHDAHVLHRDVKPSNIMVDTSGQCWLIDFGLARLRNGTTRVNTRSAMKEESPPSPITQGALGTPQYMAPEQYQERADARSDVWGLGVTLYELLALSPAFDGPTIEAIHAKIMNEDPCPPELLVRNVPRDLAAICRKTVHKNPDLRYQSAADLAEDLRRWLRFEPTMARPARTLRRMSLWSRRNKGWAAAIGIAIWAALVTVGALVVVAKEAKRGEEAAHAQAENERRELLIQQLPQMRLTNRRGGWSRKAWTIVGEAADIRKDIELRNQAAATLLGFDARIEKWIDRWGASSVAFDTTGRRLLIGGLAPDKLRGRKGEGAKVRDCERDQIVHVSSQRADGPVAFRSDGTPLQVVPKENDGLRILLWDVAKDQLIRELRFPNQASREPVMLKDLADIAVSADGSLIAAVTTGKDSKGTLVAWDANTGKAVYHAADLVSALAISPDGKLLATGDEDGKISIRSLAKSEVMASLRADRMAIVCLAFKRDSRSSDKQGALGGWLLAAGDTGGTVTLWDCEAGVPRAVCRGSNYYVHAVSFSPDGTTLASAGRDFVKLWDATTGRPLLDLPATSWLRGVAFSPDGKHLAASGTAAFGAPDMVAVWELETSRGMQTLRGLTGMVEKVLLSPNEEMLAGLAHDSRLAVWDVKTGDLLRIFDAPKAAWVDNAALAFSGDSRRLAYAASSSKGGEAILWDLGTGHKLGSWTFSPGLNNILAFHRSGKLLLFQVETRDGKQLYNRSIDRVTNPPVARVRDLLSATPTKPLFEIAEFKYWIDFPAAPLDGRFFVAIGYERADKRQIKAFDGVTGAELWSLPSEEGDFQKKKLQLAMDRNGRFLSLQSYRPEESPQLNLVEIPTGKYLDHGQAGVPSPRAGWESGMPYWISGNHHKFRGQIAIIRRGEKEPVVALGIDVRESGNQPYFSADGTRYAWGNEDGTVNIADLPEIQRRLAEIGLGWE